MLMLVRKRLHKGWSLCLTLPQDVPIIYFTSAEGEKRKPGAPWRICPKKS